MKASLFFIQFKNQLFLDYEKNRFTEAQIVSMLQQNDSGMKVTDICRDKGITTATFYSWKRKYGGMDVQQLLIQPKELIPVFLWIKQYNKLWEDRIDSFENYINQIQTKNDKK